MFSKVLIANRGVVQANCVQAVQELNAKAAVLYTTQDGYGAGARVADEAHELVTASPARAFYDADAITSIAKQIGADAVHPGYGFLAESQHLAQLLNKNDISFVSCTHNNNEDLSSKHCTKTSVQSLGIPVVPGSNLCASIDNLKEAARSLGYPLIVKPERGAGGRGLRIVHKESELESAYNYAIHHSTHMHPGLKSKIYCEKYLVKARLIEVPILRDTNGTTIVLPPLESSAQRRFQKLIMETPAIIPNTDILDSITQTTKTIANHLGLVGCASLEFLLQQDSYLFLELNSYLPPSHVASYALTGVDLLKEQIRISAGELLSSEICNIVSRGHVIGVSVNAEDPAENFAPSPGTIHKIVAKSGTGTTVYSTYASGDSVSTLYGPAIAQIVATDYNREQAVNKIHSVLSGYIIEGIKTNLPFLCSLLSSPAFKKGEFDLTLMDDPIKIKQLLDNNISNEDHNLAALIAALALHNDSNSQQILQALDTSSNYSFWNFTSRLINRNKM